MFISSLAAVSSASLTVHFSGPCVQCLAFLSGCIQITLHCHCRNLFRDGKEWIAMGNDLLSGFGRHSHPCFGILFCFLLAADAVLVPQELLRRESSEFGPMVRDPFYVVSAGARWVYVYVPFVTAGPALATPLPAAVVMGCLELRPAQTQFQVCCAQQT